MAFDYEKDPIFCKLIEYILLSEGDYSNDPDDPGGPTKYGIALNYNKEILATMGIKDVKGLTYPQAKQIYYVKYWLACGANYIHDESLAYMHFDTAVNCGVGTANIFLGRLSKNPKNYEANGKNEVLWLKLYIEYLSFRMSYYTTIKGGLKFLRGWINRLVDVNKRCWKFK